MSGSVADNCVESLDSIIGTGREDSEETPPVLKPISPEQQQIVDMVNQGYNVCIDAVAGSGKTTTSLYIGINNPSKKILLLTYNAKLKMETRIKVQKLGLNNLEVHSYHAFCVKYFDRSCYTDAQILAFLKRFRGGAGASSSTGTGTGTSDYVRQPMLLQPFNYDMIIIDEIQDMTFIYYEMVLHILKHHDNKPQIIVMGDRKQSIYAFNCADYRFLVFSEQIFNNGLPWSRGTLNTSYRLTEQMSQFINNCCQGALPIQAVKTGPPIRYIICDIFSYEPYQEIRKCFQLGYQPDDIFVLAPSVRSEKTPVRQLANYLTKNKKPIYVPISDEEKLDEDLLKGKVVFSTYHQVKGLERPVVLVFNFDNSYYQYYAKEIAPEEYHLIPNTVYVAITRATERLIIFHDYKNPYFTFLNQMHLHQNCHVIQSRTLSRNPNSSNHNQSCVYKPKRILKVTDLVKYVPISILDQCMTFLVCSKQNNQVNKDKEVNQDDTSIIGDLNIPTKCQQNDSMYEEVSEINGTCIPSYYQFLIHGQLSIYNYLIEHKMEEIRESLSDKKCLLGDDTDGENTDKQKGNGKYHFLYQKIQNPTVNKQEKCSALLELTTHWVSEKSGYIFKKQQISSYDWLDPEILDEAVNRIKHYFNQEDYQSIEFEKELIKSYNGFMIYGFVDLWNRGRGQLWEFKLVKEINPTHILQTVLYYWMMEQDQKEKVQSIHLLNIMNNNHYIIEVSMPNSQKIAEILINHHKNGLIKESNNIFLNKCEQIKQKFKI